MQNLIALLTFIAVATDNDLPPNGLKFSVGPGAPPGASIDSNSGVFTWRPREFQGPSTNKLTVIVSDDGAPPMTASREFTAIVRDALSDFRVAVGSTDVSAG